MDLFQTKDGRYVVITPDGGELWERFCRVLGREDLIPLREALTSVDESMLEERKTLRIALTEVFLSKTMNEWADVNDKENVGIVPVLSMGEVLSSPHTEARNMVVETEYAPLGRMKTIGTPYKFSETPLESNEYHRYGQDTYEVLSEFGCSGIWDELRRKKVIE